MAWSAPKIKEITCGMEVTRYLPADDDRQESL
ncbi:pyrroloquinoline quinone precursor peptide PqqA [Acuticoccus sediminis]|nr:pyrroloquinoline quinone precursor peptide PqqA [Acuticoccus sediminis]